MPRTRKKPRIYNGMERRGQRRYPFWSMATCSEILMDENSPSGNFTSAEFFASTLNISKEGILLESFERLAPGSLLSIDLASSEDDGEHYRFIGKIMHSGRLETSGLQGLGVKFVKRPRKIEQLLR